MGVSMPTRTIPSRATRLLAVVWVVSITALAAPAAAAPPEQWPDTDNGSGLNALLLLVGAPLALFAVIMLLSFLPSMARRGEQSAAAVFGEQSEWFGGPRQGTETDEAPAEGRGGASAQW